MSDGESCMEALDKMWAKKEAFEREKEKAKEKRFLASLEIEKQRLSNEKKIAEAEAKIVEAEARRAEADLLKEEKEIMTMDLTSLNPLHYEMMQKKIVAKRMADEN